MKAIPATQFRPPSVLSTRATRRTSPTSAFRRRIFAWVSPREAVSVTPLCAALLLGVAACGDSDDGNNNADPLTVSTDKGSVRGVQEGPMRKFLGIPYAAPPVAALRWKAPASAAAWTTTRDASVFGPHCPQAASSFGTASTTEDCLYLNVYTPSTTGPFPVMVWIHGGGLLTGESDDYDPSALVAKGIVVVTLNYRLGPLGFLSHPALTAEGAGSSGNYGLMDQQAALQWVKTNIAQFGGQDSNVTIFGESAGGLSVHSHLASPLSAGLFHKAIVQSGAYNLTPATLDVAEGWGTNFGVAAGCPTQTADCLRALPVTTVLTNSATLQASGSTSPTVDNEVLTRTIADALATGNYNKVPVIEGTNAHEYSPFSAYTIDTVLGRPMNAAEYPTFINETFGTTLGAAVLATYPLNDNETPAQTFDNVLTDAVFSCNARQAAQLMQAAGATVYTYEFADANAPVVFVLPPRAEGFGAYHAAEVQYVFPAPRTIVYGAPFDAAQTSLSNAMVSYWSQFAWTGNPDGTGMPTWPLYTATNDTYLTLAPGAIATTTEVAAQHKCAFWTPGE